MSKKTSAYSQYSFSKNRNVIRIGVQPLYLPTNIIVETMKRDKILYDEIKRIQMDIKFYPFLKGADVNYSLIDENLQAAVAGDMPTLTAAAIMDITAVSLMQMGFTSIVSDKVMLVKDLSDKRIGYAYGSNAHYALLEALSTEGLSEKDVHLTALEITEMPSALLNRSIAAFSAWQPAAAIALASNKNAKTMYKSLSSGYLYFSKSFLDQHLEAVSLITASQVRAVRWLEKSKTNMLTAINWAKEAEYKFTGRQNPLSNEHIFELAMNDILGMFSAPLIPQQELIINGSLYKEFVFLKKIGKISNTAQWDKISKSFDNNIINSILLEPQKYRLYETDYNRLYFEN
ncbi:aliphatic sulfonate ABC transporter substrate-binding protein [Candidatus Magnetoovum chiemensis]|nr:aliphatic sulfonate ABC transporter substrate-binding protein [Candidatus Magnetoovum chiemensis]